MRSVLAAMLAAMVSCGGGGVAQQLAEGKRLYAEGRVEESWQRFSAVQRKAPQLRDPYPYLARIALKREDPQAAIPILERGLEEVREGREDLHFFLGLLYDAADRRLDAAEQYAETLRLDPTFRPAYGRLAAIHFARGEVEAGLDLLRRACARFPAQPDVHAELIEALAKLGRWDGARAHLATLPQALRQSPPLLYWAGLIALNDHRWLEARHALEKLLTQEERNWRAWYQLANACDRLGDAEARDRALERFVQLYRAELDRAGADS